MLDPFSAPGVTKRVLGRWQCAASAMPRRRGRAERVMTGHHRQSGESSVEATTNHSPDTERVAAPPATKSAIRRYAEWLTRSPARS